MHPASPWARNMPPGERNRSASDRSESVSGREDGDAPEGAESKEILIAGDDERGLGAERGGEHEIVVEIAADGDRKRARNDDLSEVREVSDQVGGGDTCCSKSGDELRASDDLGEFCQQGDAGAECE